MMPKLVHKKPSIELLVSSCQTQSELSKEDMLRLIALWESPGVPSGYDTIAHYIAKTDPEGFCLIGDPVVDLKEDEAQAAIRARKDGIIPVPVFAPVPYQQRGVAVINAYPITLIENILIGSIS